MNLYAVLQNEKVLATLDVEERTETLCMVALAKDPSSLKCMFADYDKPFLNNRSIGEYIIRKNGSRPTQWLPHIYQLTPEMVKFAIEQDPVSLIDIPSRCITMELCKHAVSKRQNVFAYVPKQFMTEELCNLAVRAPFVRTDVPALRYVPRHMQTPPMCRAAVAAWPQAIRYVVEQTEDLCLLAIAGAHGSIRDIDPDRQTDKVCDAAISVRWDNLYYIRNQTETLCIKAIRMNYRALSLIHNQTPKMCLLAVQHDWRAIWNVRDRTPQLIEIANRTSSDVGQSYINAPINRGQTKERCLVKYRKSKDLFKEIQQDSHRRYIVRVIVCEKLTALVSNNLSTNLLSEVAFCLDTYAIFRPLAPLRAEFMGRARHLTQLDRWNLSAMVREAASMWAAPKRKRVRIRVRRL